MTDNGGRGLYFIARTSIIVYSQAVLIAVATVTSTVLYFIALVIVAVMLISSETIYGNWKDDINSLVTLDDIEDLVKKANTYEFLFNLFGIYIAITIACINYTLPLAYLLFSFFFNIAVFVFVKIMVPFSPVLVPFIDYLSRLLLAVIEGNAGDFGQLDENNPGNFGSTQEETTQNNIEDVTNRSYHIIRSVSQFLVAMEDTQWHEFVNFLVDPFLRNLAAEHKFTSTTAALLRTGGSWASATGLLSTTSKWTVSMERAICEASARDSNRVCSESHVSRNNLCALYENSGTVCPIPVPRCDMNTQSDCGYYADSLAIDTCDEIECSHFVLDVAQNSLNMSFPTCSSWDASSNIIMDCMTRVNAYSEVNNTALSVYNPAGLAIEICIVFMLHHIKTCTSPSAPSFSFDLTAAESDICQAPSALFVECACPLAAPLCNQSCCHRYADHVREQFVRQMGDATCSSLYTEFGEDRTWCPLTHVPEGIDSFPDNSYTSMWCSFFRTVVGPACAQVAGSTLVRNIGSIDVASIAFGNQQCDVVFPAACAGQNSTIDTVAIDVIDMVPPFLEIYARINNSTAPRAGEPIPTTLSVGDDADAIYTKAQNMHYCKQYSQEYKHKNAIHLSQEWNILGDITAYCDADMIRATADLARISETYVRKTRDSDGLVVRDNMEGVPADWFVFSGGIDPSMQGMGCSQQKGLSPEETTDMTRCVEALRQKVLVYSGRLQASTDETTRQFKAQENYTSSFYGSSGIVPIDDAEMQQQVERTNNALSATFGYIDQPFIEPPAVGDSYRSTYFYPDEKGSRNDRNPGYAFGIAPRPKSEGSRVLLSVDTLRPIAPNYIGDAINLVHKWHDLTMGFAKSPDRIDRAQGDKFAMRVARAYRTLLYEIRGKHEEEYKRQGHSIDDVEHFTTTRKLLFTLHPGLNKTIVDRLQAVFQTPIAPSGGTQEAFSGLITKHLIQKAKSVAENTITRLAPSIMFSLISKHNSLFPSRMISIDAEEQQILASFGNSSSPTCISSMSEPYKCCAKTSNSCCRGLIFCLPDYPDYMYITETTTDTVDRLLCKDFDSFFPWWKWLLRILGTGSIGIVNYILGTSIRVKAVSLDDIPVNAFSCMLLTSRYFWRAIAGIFAISIIVSTQLLSVYLLVFSAFRKDQRIHTDIIESTQTKK